MKGVQVDVIIYVIIILAVFLIIAVSVMFGFLDLNRFLPPP